LWPSRFSRHVKYNTDPEPEPIQPILTPALDPEQVLIPAKDPEPTAEPKPAEYGQVCGPA